jgi:hypothetical protein
MGLSFELQHIEFGFVDPAKRNTVFSPVQMRFLGKPNFETSSAAAGAGAAAGASAAAASVSAPAPKDPSLRLRPRSCLWAWM